MYCRFVVTQHVEDDPRQVGLFAAAYYLRREAELYAWDRERLEELLSYFREHLPIPPEGTIPDDAIFWFVDTGPFHGFMRDLAFLVSEYGFTVELKSSEFVGRVVYQDQYQVAALPRTDRFRQRPN
jgi:hypothetical protein